MSPPSSASADNPSGWVKYRRVMSFIGCALVVAGALNLGLRVYRGLSCSSWPATWGQIEWVNDGTVFRVRKDGSKVFAGDSLVRYRYSVDGHEFVGNRVDFADENIDSYTIPPATLATIARLHPIGAKTEVFYDPDAPERSVLHPGYPIGTILVESAVMAVVMALVFLGLVVSFRRRTSPQDEDLRDVA